MSCECRNDLSGHIARASVTWDELCDALIRIIDLAVAIAAFMGDEQLALEAQAAMCDALERSEKEFRNSVEKLVMQVCRMQTRSVGCGVYVYMRTAYDYGC